MSWYWYSATYPSDLEIQTWKDQGYKVYIQEEGEGFKVNLSITATWIKDESMPDFFKKLVKSK